MSEGKITQNQEVYICGTCENVIQRLDSLQAHLVFTHGCNKLTSNRFPTCNCGTVYDNRSNWNHHNCPGKKAILTAIFDKMVKKDKDCYRTETASVTKRAAYNTKSPTKRATPVKKSSPKKVTPTKKKKQQEKKKDKKKVSKKDKKKKNKSSESESEDSTESLNSESESETSSSSDGSTISTSDADSEESGVQKKRKGETVNRETKKPKHELSEEHERQWKLMVQYSESFQHAEPDQTISRASMVDLTIHERPGCVAFLKTYTQQISPFAGFAKREILKFVRGDSRMFICRDLTHPESVGSVVALVNELSPRVIKIWEEDKDLKQGIVSSTSYFWVDTLVVSGNMVGVYTLDNSLLPVPQKDQICVSCLPFNVDVSQGFLDLLTQYQDSMVPHHHISNDDKKSWKGISLKGYTQSHKDLYKPEEMDKLWQRNNAISATQSYEELLRKTDLMIHFKYYLTQLKKALPGKFHRIQILSLAPGGEIQRHSDKPIQSDLDKNQFILRFHLPLISNDGVKLRILNLHGDTIEILMKVGFIYLLDNRKPHSVVNEGEIIRYHLVFDVVLNKEIESLLERSFQISTPLDDFNEKFQAWQDSTEFTTIELQENEEDKIIGEAKRIEKELLLEKKEEQEENDMEVDKIAHHSQNLFSIKNNKNEIEEESSTTKKGAKSNTNNCENKKNSCSFSISDKFDGDSTVSAEEGESTDSAEDTSNYKLGKKGSATNSSNTPSKEEGKKPKKKNKKVIDDSIQKSVDANVQEFVMTIDSDKEEVEEKKGNGFIDGDLEEFLKHYELSQFEETFRKNQLSDKVSTLNLLTRQDLNDMGLVSEEDLSKWRKFNPSL